jgi:diguanylate cyclase (GGDEF)-like protein/PAS domain S-box-containing protein
VLLCLAGVAYLMAVVLWLAASGVSDARRDAAAAFGAMPLGLAAWALAWRAATAGELEGRSRRVWRGLAAAFGILWATDLYSLIGIERLAWAAGAGHLAFALVAAWAFASFPSVWRSEAQRGRFRLDVASVMLGGATLTWYFALDPALAGGGGAGDTVPAVAATVANLALAFGCLCVTIRRPTAASRSAARAAAGGVVLLLAAGAVRSYIAARGGVGFGGLAGAIRGAGFLTVACAGVLQRRLAARPRNVDDAGPGAAADRGYSVLAYAVVAVGYALLVVEVREHWTGRLFVLVAGALLLTVLVMLRQARATRENSELLHQAEARRSEARFRSLVQHSSDVIAVLDGDATVRFASPSVERLFGYPPESLVGTRLLDVLHPDDAAEATAFLSGLAGEPGATARVAWRLRHPDGSWLNVESVATNLLSEPNVAGIVVNARDVTDRTKLEAQLAYQAFHDPLTQLANRALFRDRVEHALARAGRSPEHVAVLFLDLDQFKAVNDTRGHAAGDQLLVQVAGRLLNATRGSDTVARLGGDEFALLIENVQHARDELIVAERILKAMTRPVAIGAAEVVIGCSIGIASAQDGETAEELLRNADVAMYRAKQGGRGGFAVFEPEMYEEFRDRIALEEDLRRAVDAGEFVVVYQPIVDLESEHVTAVEALVRWAHPRRGLVSPAEFVAVAEETGLIVPLGRHVLREACRQCAEWQAVRSGAGIAPLTVSVNLSSRQLQDEALVSDVAAALADSGLRPSELVLEITESMIMQDSERTLERLHELKALGVRLAIDDFGTGYSSLSYLQKFPVDVLKIDKVFVDGVARGGQDAALARTIIALGEMLNLRTIAEGVEQPAQQARLKALGCGLAQGYLFARPMPASAVQPLLLRQQKDAPAADAAPGDDGPEARGVQALS